MRKKGSRLLALLLATLLAGCLRSAPAPAPVSDPTQAPPASKSPDTGATAPACTPGSSAVDLPASADSGVTVRPPQSPGTADRPWIGYLTVDQLEPQSGIIGHSIIRKAGTATVGTGEVWLRGFLMPAPSPDWLEKHLKLEGVMPDQRNYTPMGDSGSFDLHIPDGKAGDSFTLTFSDVSLGDGSTGEFSVTFCRQTPPQASLTYKTADDWKPVGPYLPMTSPLHLRIAFTAEMNRQSVEQALTGPHDKEGRSQGDWISAMSWIDSRTVELTVNQPAPVMRVVLRGAQDQNGLMVTGGAPVLYAGEPAQVVAVDPASGQESTLATLPPEPVGATLSPDGKRLRLTSRQVRAGLSDMLWLHQLIDLEGGGARRLEPEDLQGQWLPSGELFSIWRKDDSTLRLLRQTGSERKESILADLPPHDSFWGSPDGAWVALLERTGTDTPPEVGVRFLLVKSDGSTRKPVAGEAKVYRPGKGGIRLHGPAWSPDSSRIAMTQAGANGSATLLLADLEGGALRTLAADLPGVQPHFDPVTWSPDGRQILVGQVLLDAATGQVIRRIESVQGLPRWSPDGQSLLFQAGDWTAITAYNLRTGESTALGEGMLLGWRPDGKALLIRWPDSAHRTQWGI